MYESGLDGPVLSVRANRARRACMGLSTKMTSYVNLDVVFSSIDSLALLEFKNFNRPLKPSIG